MPSTAVSAVNTAVTQWLLRIPGIESRVIIVENLAVQVVVQPSFQLRATIAEKNACSLATSILPINEDEFSVAFNGSPMKRAKAVGLKRNGLVLLATAAGA